MSKNNCILSQYNDLYNINLACLNTKKSLNSCKHEHCDSKLPEKLDLIESAKEMKTHKKLRKGRLQRQQNKTDIAQSITQCKENIKLQPSININTKKKTKAIIYRSPSKPK